MRDGGMRESARPGALYVYVCACMCVYVRAAVSGQVHLVWARGQRDAYKANHMDPNDGGTLSAAMFNPFGQFASFFTDDRCVTRERESELSQRWLGGEAPRSNYPYVYDPQNPKGGLGSRVAARRKLAKWSTCGAEPNPKFEKNHHQGRLVLPCFPESPDSGF